MKKIIVIALVLTTLCFALAACGSNSSDFGKSTSQGQSGSQAVSQQGETAQDNSESAASSNSRSTTAIASTPKNKVAKDDANMQTLAKGVTVRSQDALSIHGDNVNGSESAVRTWAAGFGYSK